MNRTSTYRGSDLYLGSFLLGFEIKIPELDRLTLVSIRVPLPCELEFRPRVLHRLDAPYVPCTFGVVRPVAHNLQTVPAPHLLLKKAIPLGSHGPKLTSTKQFFSKIRSDPGWVASAQIGSWICSQICFTNWEP